MYLCVCSEVRLCRNLPLRVEEEATSNQKLATERANAESKIKTLEEQVTLNEDNIAKVRRAFVVCVCVCVHVGMCVCVGGGGGGGGGGGVGGCVGVCVGVGVCVCGCGV